MDVAQLLKAIQASWPRWSGLALGWALAIVVATAVVPLGGAPIGSALGAFVGLVITACWTLARRTKQCPGGKFGFVIAIAVDDSKTQRLFERDFCRNLEDLLRSGSLAESVWVYQIPNYRLQACPTPAEAMAIRLRTNSAFVLFGEVRTREGEPTQHYVDLHGLVGHAPTHESNKSKLAQEFTELLPRRLVTPAGAELPAFELTSSLSSIAAMYIAGIAAFLSGAPDQAEKMYNDAELLARPSAPRFPAAQAVLDRLPIRRTEIVVARASAHYRAWRESRSELELERMNAVLAVAPPVASSVPEWKTLQAIGMVAKFGDNFRQIEADLVGDDPNDPVTQVNLAFFDIADGDFRAAARHYRRAAELNLSLDTVDEIMCFIDWFRDFRPQFRTEMTFALGFICYCLLEDFALATEYFDEFNGSRGDRYEDSAARIPKWLAQIRQQGM